METWRDWYDKNKEGIGDRWVSAHAAKPYKLDRMYRFVFITGKTLFQETIGKVVDATDNELVLELRDQGRVWPLIVGRAAVETAIEVELEDEAKIAERRKAKEPGVPK